MRKLRTEEIDIKHQAEYGKQKSIPVTVLLDNIRSLHNVGTIFRTGDAFKIEKIILTGVTGVPPHSEISKTALGATETVEWYYFENGSDAIKFYKDLNYFIAAAEQTNKSLSISDWTEIQFPLLLIFGNEVRGVEQKLLDLCDLAVEIPQFGTKHSLNVSVAAGIFFYHLFTVRNSP